MDNIQFKRIINQVIELIKDNKSVLEKLKKEDYEAIPFEVDIYIIIDILKQNINREISYLSSDAIFVEHYGNPYLTTLICIESLIYQSSITIGIEDLCLGLNKAIVKFFNDIFKEHRLEIEISLKNNFTKNEIQESNFDKIICLGNSNSYSELRKINGAIVKNVPLFSISVYYDSQEFDDLVHKIISFADKNFYEIEIFDDEEDFDDVVYMINSSKDIYCSVILSDDENKQKQFKEKIQSEVICVNENPFTHFKFDISGKIF